MIGIMLVGLLILNFAISWFNAWSVGKVWAESKMVGGSLRFLAWCGAIMSACGFTWVYLAILTIATQFISVGKPPAPLLTPQEAEAMFSLGYLIIIGPVLGSGLGITLNSWAHFWRKRSFGSGAVAGWNTFAQVHNTYRAISAVPQALSKVGDLFSGKGSSRSRDGRGMIVLLVVLLVVLAVTGGVLTTVAIIRRTARQHVNELEEQFGSDQMRYSEAYN